MATRRPIQSADDTMEPRQWSGGSDQHTTLFLPSLLLTLDLATNPAENRVAVGTVGPKRDIHRVATANDAGRHRHN